ncbi:ABC transporter permease [Sphaerisporangium rufum]|uniref:ABC transporter permease n=1 Tax=Sphaerisporangium rufum TaxID=1381558 RepID=A0A919UXI0_9ACTN|nr:ATP-binding cassette domain-containing protein [Sphaerisporangium rufum]GII75869.1 ABC transporter permease [Sphaerisporangium rufum]
MTSRFAPVLLLFRAAWRASPRDVVTVLVCDPLGRVAEPLVAVGVGVAVAGVLSASRPQQMLGVTLFVTALLLIHVLGTFGIAGRVRLEAETARTIDGWLIQAMLGLRTVDPLQDGVLRERVDRIRSRERVDLTGSAFGGLVLVLGAVLQFGLTVALLADVSLWLVLIPLLAVPALHWNARAFGAEDRADEKAGPLVSRAGVLVEHLMSPAGGLAARAGGAGVGLVRRAEELWDEAARHRDRGDRSAFGWTMAGTAIVSASVAAALGWTAWAAAAGRLGLPDLAVVIALTGQLGVVLGNLMQQTTRARRLLRVARDLDGVLGELRRQGAAPAAGTGRQAPPAGGALILSGLSYTYPGREVAAVRAVDLEIPPGSVVAMVGENGSGKTTLVKLMTGLLTPDSGEIQQGGMILTAGSRADWQQGVTALMQDFGRYELTVREGVALGDVEAAAERPELLAAACTKAGLDPDVERLPAGLDTQTGSRWSHGVDLSGGQWQKIALARSHLRQDWRLFLMDEPSSALDIEAEARLFDRFRELTAQCRAGGGVALFVSHRLAAAARADLIVVLDDGVIAQVGTPAELRNRPGPYQELSAIQESNYDLSGTLDPAAT